MFFAIKYFTKSRICNVEQQQKDQAVAATFQFKKGDRCQVRVFGFILKKIAFRSKIGPKIVHIPV
jgi:hypothetical protein